MRNREITFSYSRPDYVVRLMMLKPIIRSDQMAREATPFLLYDIKSESTTASTDGSLFYNQY